MKAKRNFQSAGYWQKHIDVWIKSGQTQNDYCLSQGISKSTFYKWRKKMLDKLPDNPMGRKNWLFCWTELGAQRVAIIQTILVTCKMLGINPYHYLVDVLQRIAIHPDSNIIELTPRVWKEKFAHQRMLSDLEITELSPSK